MVCFFRAESLAMSALSEPAALVGSLLGKVYRVIEPIGVGGMAVVYLVEHQTLLKRFAAKVLSPDLASSLEARARFIQEAHAASALDHENIVSISDFGTTNDQRPFFVMELLRGKTLDRRLADGTMTIEEVVAVAVPVARALSHAHAEGIVHLDVKPENIFLVQRSRGRWGVKVVDFGIAKTPLNPRLNKLGETAGSPLFMAPEVCRGDDDVDQRADVYSFGIMLYLMLCGRLPFVDDSTQRVLQMQLVELPPPPNQVNTQLSPEIAMVIERALAKDRADRYPSMEALLHDFAAALPPGADRLLIEAQSGAAVHDTPFSGSLSIPRPGSQPRASSTVSPISPLPRRTRSTPMVLFTVAVVIALIGLATWRQFVDPGTRSGSRTADNRTADSRTASAGAVPAPAPEEPAAAAQVAAAKGTDDSTEPPSTEPPATEPPSSEPPSTEPVNATPPGAASPTALQAAAAPEPAAEPADDVKDDQPGAPTEIAMAEPAPVRPSEPVIARPKAPAAAIKKPPVRSKPAPRPVVRTALLKPAKPPVVAAATVAPAPPPAPPSAPPPPAAEAQGPQTAAGSPIETEVQPEPPALAPPPPPPPEATAPPPPVTTPTLAVVKAPARPVPPPAGSLDATPSVARLEVKGSLSPSIVRRSLERTLSSLRGCYRTAARAAKATPAVELQLTYEIDENRLATQVATSGANFGSLSTCAAGVAGQIRTQEAPDVGTVQVTAVIRFRPS
jgi:eukaryotic-like serine/threonine-protein kinase